MIAVENFLKITSNFNFSLVKAFPCFDKEKREKYFYVLWNSERSLLLTFDTTFFYGQSLSVRHPVLHYNLTFREGQSVGLRSGEYVKDRNDIPIVLEEETLNPVELPILSQEPKFDADWKLNYSNWNRQIRREMFNRKLVFIWCGHEQIWDDKLSSRLYFLYNNVKFISPWIKRPWLHLHAYGDDIDDYMETQKKRFECLPKQIKECMGGPYAQ